MRKTRFIGNCRCYHMISRLAHQAFFLDDDEKTRAVELLRRVEEFSGVIVLAYAIMSNHFHIFIYVPEPEEIDDEEILRRINALYRKASLAQVFGEWTRLKDEEAKLLEHSRPTEKYASRFGEYRRSFLRRMWNSSEFMRTYKQHFTMSFNGRRDHHGTMFEGRYHERNHKPEEPVMWRTAAYVDINAWNAGIVGKAEDYEWCSFAAAVRGDKKARRGYAFMYGNGDWETIRACHEKSMREAMGEVLSEREREQEEREAKGHGASSVRKYPPRSKADPGLEAPKGFSVELERGDPAVAERILELLADGPMRPSAIRKAVGIRNCTHFNRYYLSPLLGKGIIARTDPNHPQSPQQRYCLA
ncbi:MAG: transposase [bacterium]|nr:transposase [Candidatus Colisoma equi]